MKVCITVLACSFLFTNAAIAAKNTSIPNRAMQTQAGFHHTYGARSPGMNEARQTSYSSAERQAMVDEGNARLHALKIRIREARTAEEREALIAQKREIEQAIVSVQQMN